ncbi:MlaC/ttg2D family ABC transporter substrate-binding protein [Pleionea litopenaei]|uniref:ABC transporter substrate-binding protein n=1 Tax=Pleionea litopenaei TaxID=3070815 RepID=A0AA51RUS4_9GAMM|nr:ABC transporter substrate-binding protein [Pleionea sp. HL-JVS1]WMS88086.1 ABC transporter substrate-binding protein [Pleionea sp. HL-JVS1]
MNTLFKAFLLLMASMMASITLAATEPKQMLQSAADNIISYLKENQSKLAENPQLSVDLVKKELVPYIDQEALGRRVLAKEWRTATPQQQQQFVELFVDLVIDTYAKGLAQYNNQTFEFEDTEYNDKMTLARVKSQMNQTDGEPVKIDYLLKKPKGLDEWRVVDVRIEGISMANSYKNQFAQQIQNEGLQSVLDKLAKKEITLDQTNAN